VVSVVRLLAFACALLTLLGTPMAGARVRIDLDRDVVSADESFTVTFTADADQSVEPDFSPLERDFEIVGRSSQTTMQIINGRAESGQSWELTLIPKRAGKLEIPAISFGGEQSTAQTLEVRPGATGGRGDGDVFITIEATPQPAYVQQQIVVKVRLYVGVMVGSATLSDLQAPGAVIEKLGDDRRYEESRGGRDYTVFERRYAVFAERSGTLTLGSVEFAGQLMGRGYFGRYKRAASEPMDLRIAPAQPGVVPWLPAEALTIEEQWPQDPPQFHAGEPVTRTLTLTARGLTAAQLPPLGGGSLAGFKQYADQPSLDDRVTSDGVTGVRTEKIAFLPLQPGRFTLPAVELSWWNTSTQSNQSLRVPEREIEVLPGAVQEPAASAAAPAANPQVAPARGRPGIAATPDPRRWIALSAALGGGWLMTVVLWWWSTRRRRVSNATAAPVEDPPDLRAARRAVKEACERGDASAALRALHAWAQARWPTAPGGAWRELVSRSGPQLRTEIETLERTLYGARPTTWNGRPLWEHFESEAPPPASSKIERPALAPLHP
jgi:hypothetical protein